MARVRWHSYETVYQNDTPVLEFLFLKRDGQSVVDLSNYAGEVAFWLEDAAPHVVRAGQIDGVNGIVRYFAKGDEFTTVGDVLFQATVRAKDAAQGIDRAYFPISHPVVRWRVIQKP